METVTVAASRAGFALSGPMLIVSVIVFAVIVYAVVTSLKHLRNRHERGA